MTIDSERSHMMLSRARRLRQLAAAQLRAWNRASKEAARCEGNPALCDRWLGKANQHRKDMNALEDGASALETLAKSVG